MMKWILAKFILALSLVHSIGAYAQTGPLHVETGLTLPAQFEDMIHEAAKDSLDPLNSNYSYVGGSDVATVYIFRATHPNAALWFERAQSVLRLIWANRGLGDANPQRLVTFAGAKTPNGFAQEFAVSSKTKSTAIALGEVNGWIVKVRLTSDKYTADEIAKKLDRLLLTLVTKQQLPPINPLILPDECPASKSVTSLNALVASEVIANPKPETVALIGMQLIPFAEKVAGGPSSLARNPELYCRATFEGQSALAMTYRPKDNSDDSWTILFADSGTNISGSSSLIMEGKKDAQPGGILTANALEKVNLLVVAKGVPSPEVSFSVGANFILKGGDFLSAVPYNSRTVLLSLPDKK
jgi:hypothetical protein